MMDSYPSGTKSQINSSMRCLWQWCLLSQPQESNEHRVTKAEVGTREWAAAGKSQSCCLEECGSLWNFRLEKRLDVASRASSVLAGALKTAVVRVMWTVRGLAQGVSEESEGFLAVVGLEAVLGLESGCLLSIT